MASNTESPEQHPKRIISEEGYQAAKKRLQEKTGWYGTADDEQEVKTVKPKKGRNPQSKLRWIGQKIGTAIGSLVGIGFVGFCVLIGLKGCIVTVWTPPDEPKTYEVQGTDGRFMRMVFLPDQTAINAYSDPNNNEHEAVLYKLRWGVVGKHYFWRLWNVDEEGDSPFGLRFSPKGAEPIIFEYEILQKWRIGHGDSSFPPVGKSIETVFWFKDGAMRFADIWLEETETDQEFVDLMLQLLKKEKQQDGEPQDMPQNLPQ